MITYYNVLPRREVKSFGNYKNVWLKCTRFKHYIFHNYIYMLTTIWSRLDKTVEYTDYIHQI